MSNFLIVVILLVLFISLPEIIERIWFIMIFIISTLTIGVASFIDINYSPTIYLNRKDKFRSLQIWTKKVSPYSVITYKKYQQPTFYINGHVFDADLNLISDYDDVNELICIYGSNDISFIKDIIKEHKKLDIINNIYIVDNRRCRTEFLLNNKIVTVDFPAGSPNVSLFLKLNEIYGLSEKFSYIDFRYGHFIVGR